MAQNDPTCRSNEFDTFSSGCVHLLFPYDVYNLLIPTLILVDLRVAR